jgi:hypothetical protein
MAERRLRIWYDREGDYLEVIFDQSEGYFLRVFDPQGQFAHESATRNSALTRRRAWMFT